MRSQIKLHVKYNVGKVLSLSSNSGGTVMRVVLSRERRLGSKYLDASESVKQVAKIYSKPPNIVYCCPVFIMF